MSVENEERSRSSKTRRLIVIVPLLSILGFSSLFAGSGGSGPSFVPVSFGGSVQISCPGCGSSVVSPSFSDGIGDLIVAISSGIATSPLKVSTLTDSHGDIFTFRQSATRTGGSPVGIDVIEIWTGFDATGGSNTVTANWNISFGVTSLIISTYKGIAGTGSVGSGNLLSATATFPITVATAGSWIVGGTVLRDCGKAPIVPGAVQVQRNTNCTTAGSQANGIQTDLEDTSQPLANLLYNYLSTFTSGDWAAVGLEITSTIPAPLDAVKELSQVQTGSITVSLVNQNIGQTTVTFNPAYLITPQFRLLPTVVGIPTTALTETGALPFLSIQSAGQAWPAMPAAQTEIFGDTTHELWSDLTQVISAVLIVNCPTAAAAVGGEFLDVQYSTNGATWLSLTGVTAFRVLLDGNNLLGNCQIGPFPAMGNAGIPQAIVAGAKGKVFLRVVGGGGDGITDAPVFTEISLLLFSNLSVSCVWGTGSLGLTASQAIVKVSCGTPITQTFTFQWFAGVPQ